MGTLLMQMSIVFEETQKDPVYDFCVEKALLRKGKARGVRVRIQKCILYIMRFAQWLALAGGSEVAKSFQNLMETVE